MCEEVRKPAPPKGIAAELMFAVTYAYLNLTKDTADGGGHSQLKVLAENFGMTPIKVRKMLRCFGTSYLYPIFIRFGVICDGEPKV